MSKIKITEGRLKEMISEAVRETLNELDWQTYNNAARKRYQQAYNGATNGRANDTEMVNKGKALSSYANEMFMKKYGVSIYDVSNPNWRNQNPGHPSIKAWKEQYNIQ